MRERSDFKSTFHHRNPLGDIELRCHAKELFLGHLHADATNKYVRVVYTRCSSPLWIPMTIEQFWGLDQEGKDLSSNSPSITDTSWLIWKRHLSREDPGSKAGYNPNKKNPVNGLGAPTKFSSPSPHSSNLEYCCVCWRKHTAH